MSRPRQSVLKAFRWVVTSGPLLFGCAAVIVGSSFAASLATDEWHRFQRSGALVVSIGVILSTRRLLRRALDAMLTGRTYFDSHGEEKEYQDKNRQDFLACMCGFWMVGTGTVIWAYGDLVECVVKLSAPRVSTSLARKDMSFFSAFVCRRVSSRHGRPPAPGGVRARGR